jgi:phosphomannomutase / phosphoglucomutase
MGRYIYILAAVCVLMVIIAGAGAFLVSKKIVAQSKVDAVSSTANGIALALSEQVKLLDSLLDKMAQDPDVINAALQNNPDLLASAATKLESHLPGILSIKFLLYEEKDPNKAPRIAMGFADLDMARKAFDVDQSTAIQGDINKDRHLAIARRIMNNNTPIGVVLASLKYDFIDRIVSATPLKKGYIEVRQDKLVLAATGDKKDSDAMDNPPIDVPNTEWEIFYGNANATNFVELSLIMGIIFTPALIVALSFFVGVRKITAILSDDVAWVMKAFKDIMTEKPIAQYPVKFGEIQHLISKLSQFKRLSSEKWFDI